MKLKAFASLVLFSMASAAMADTWITGYYSSDPPVHRYVTNGWHWNTGNLYIGGTGITSGNGMFVGSGSTVQSDTAYVGYGPRAWYSWVTVSDPGSEWQVDDLHIGYRKNNIYFSALNSLKVKNGGKVHCESASIESSSKATVAGQGSLWSVNQFMNLRRGARLTVSNQASIVFGDPNIHSAPSGGTILLSTDGYKGLNSYGGTIENDGDTIVGNAAALSLYDEATMSTAGNVILGDNYFGTLNLNKGVLNSKTGSLGQTPGSWGYTRMESGSWYMKEDLCVGQSGSGSNVSIDQGSLITNRSAIIGQHAGANDNRVFVAGKWKNSGSVTIGQASNTANFVRIYDGGELTAHSVTINGSGNSLQLNDGGTLKILSDFDASMDGFSFNSNSTLSVAGTLSGLSVLKSTQRLETPNLLGDIEIHGTFAPGNSVADSLVDGNMFLAADGILEMELGTDSDRLTVRGDSELSGTVALLFGEGYIASKGDRFDLFDWEGDVSGSFSLIDAPTLTGDLQWDTSRLYTDGTLSVIPEPANALLMLSAVPALLLQRKRSKSACNTIFNYRSGE